MHRAMGIAFPTYTSSKVPHLYDSQVALFATTILSGVAADWLQSEKHVRTVRVRKIFNTVTTPTEPMALHPV